MTHKNSYGTYSIPNDNTPAANTVRRGQVYEPNTIHFMIKNCGSDSIVHCGTYFGDFLPALGKNCKNKVYSFEPNTKNWEHATKTIELNGLTNVTVDNVALSNENGEVTMKIANNNVSIGGGSHIIKDKNEGSDYQTIKTIKLDDYLGVQRQSDKISIIQLDVEGHEEEALGGALITIKESRPILIVENRPSDEFFQKHLQPLGYQYHSKKLHMNSIIHTNGHKLLLK